MIPPLNLENIISLAQSLRKTKCWHWLFFVGAESTFDLLDPFFLLLNRGGMTWCLLHLQTGERYSSGKKLRQTSQYVEKKEEVLVRKVC